MKTSLVGMNREEITAFLDQWGYPRYRGAQLFAAVYRRRMTDFSQITDLPLQMREHLEQVADVGIPRVEKRQISRDGTCKLLLRLSDGNTIEAVSMVYLLDRSRSRMTLCLSSQVGCPVGCPFCATGKSGFVRNLSAGEIVGQALALVNQISQPDNLPAEEVDRLGLNIVFMGMGEPLLNLDQVLEAGRLLHEPEGMNISWRRITISTSGVVPWIKRLVREKLPINLAVSLHAADNRLRDRLVPINRRYPLESLIPACREYAHAGGRRLTFEYVLLPKTNDSPEQANQLADLLAGLPALVNLIPVNPVDHRPAGHERKKVCSESRSNTDAAAFAGILRNRNIAVTVRGGKGGEIAAACGQLRSRAARERKGYGSLGKDRSGSG